MYDLLMTTSVRQADKRTYGQTDSGGRIRTEALAWHIKHSITQCGDGDGGAANTKQGHKLYYRASCIWFRSQS